VVASGLYILYREVVRAEGREPVTAAPAAPVAAPAVTAEPA
jgi:hypothetical protein